VSPGFRAVRTARRNRRSWVRASRATSSSSFSQAMFGMAAQGCPVAGAGRVRAGWRRRVVGRRPFGDVGTWTTRRVKPGAGRDFRPSRVMPAGRRCRTAGLRFWAPAAQELQGLGRQGAAQRSATFLCRRCSAPAGGAGMAAAASCTHHAPFRRSRQVRVCCRRKAGGWCPNRQQLQPPSWPAQNFGIGAGREVRAVPRPDAPAAMAGWCPSP